MARRKRGEATQSGIIKQALILHDGDANAAYLDIAYRVGTEPFIYRRQGVARVKGEQVNPYKIKSTSSIPYELRTQHEMCLGQCRAINMEGKSGQTRNRGGRNSYNSGENSYTETETSTVETEVEVTEEEQEEYATETIEEEEVRVTVEPGTLKADADELLYWIQKIWRPLVEGRNSTGDAMDSVGMRPALNGAKMLRQGIPVSAIKDSLTMDYPDEIRRILNVSSVDTSRINPEPREGTGDDVSAEIPGHRQTAYVIALAKARVPVYLYGGKGVGKSELARQIAHLLDLPFGMVSMSPGTSPSAFFGRPKLDGSVVSSKFTETIRNGGVYLFDEIDNGEAELLTLLNNVMANGHFTNDATGEEIPVHEDAIFIAAGNTIGNGSEGGYLRQPLDEATKDRWAAGRVRMVLDESLETQLYWRILA